MTLKSIAAVAAATFATNCISTPSVSRQAPEWFGLTGTEYVAANIHETSSGFAGWLVSRDGSGVPLRSVRRDGTALTFTVPALGASVVATLAATGGWVGQWTAIGDSGSQIVTLTPSDMPSTFEGSVATISGKRQMHMICVGAGSPTVVMDYGGGGTQKKDWGDTPAGVAKAANTRVCTYDRAGRGISDPGPIPRDASAVVQDLREMLEAAGIAPPYVLVGHSMASFHVRLFANTHLEEVSGLVLIDPSGDDQSARFSSAYPGMLEQQNRIVQAQASQNCPKRLRERPVAVDDPLARSCGGNDPDTVEAMRSEIAELIGASNAMLLATRRPYGNLPLIVLTRGDYSSGFVPNATTEENQAMIQVWHAMHAEMAALSTAGEQRIVPGAGHFIQLDAPHAVIAAIRDVVDRARKY